MNIQLKLFSVVLLFVSVQIISCTQQDEAHIQTGNVIFIHPDGCGYNTWAATRLLTVGPDADLNWDRMAKLGAYRSHQLNAMGTTSNAGATAHAFGVKCEMDDYGIDPQRPFNSLSGKPFSLMIEARRSGYSTGLINSGHINEPGTGAFVANVLSRRMNDDISDSIFHSATDLLFSGGETYLLPTGTMGFHGMVGTRQDGRNLIEEAERLGYTVVFTREQLLALSPQVNRVLGIFAAKHTFNDLTEEELLRAGLPHYDPGAPSLSEMISFALAFFQAKHKPFMLVVEEEGPDNFSNTNNALGAITALARADEAIGTVMAFIAENPSTALVVASDSDAGGMQVNHLRDEQAALALPAHNDVGSPVDGPSGTGSLPFSSKPDQFGQTFPFYISWAGSADMYGGVIAKAHGLNSHYLPNNVDNTDIYRFMYLNIFGKWLD